MKQTTKMSRAISQLEHIYNSLNTDFYAGALPVPVITVQSKPGSYGHCTTSKIWRRKDGGAYELNIAAEVLDKPIEETLDTILHEMVHLYCRENGIKETSRGGTYHNAKFKSIAETHGLQCVPCGKYGWNTAPTDTLVEYALSKGWNEITLGRSTITLTVTAAQTNNGTRTRTSSTRKVVCPACGQSVRATKHVNIICGDCLLPMVEAG
ncbi:MAG: SprT-like domain-containing protein [Oscillospiraceae bacterium]|nr:SprT-like domain-containing protein [Oscillospiraceae bacterium]